MGPKLVVVGAAGRMGRRIIALAVESGEYEITAAVDAAGNPDIGKDAGLLAGVGQIGINIGPQFPDAADVVIDFSLPQAAGATVDFCVDKKAALVMGTTGLAGDLKTNIENAGQSIPVIYGTNMSVGMNVLFALIGKAAQMLGPDYDIEIVEQHHKFKKDAPSGSALTLAENICKAIGKDADSTFVFGREGKEALRQHGEIGIHAVRAGDIAGKHDVMFTTMGESVTLGHNAHNRDNFVRGALRAGQWLVGKQPGLYTMADVLGLG